MTHYDSIKRAIDSAMESLRAAGMREEHLAEIGERLTFMAGSYLPPVSGEFRINLDDLRKT